MRTGKLDRSVMSVLSLSSVAVVYCVKTSKHILTLLSRLLSNYSSFVVSNLRAIFRQVLS